MSPLFDESICSVDLTKEGRLHVVSLGEVDFVCLFGFFSLLPFFLKIDYKFESFRPTDARSDPISKRGRKSVYIMSEISRLSFQQRVFQFPVKNDIIIDETLPVTTR